MVGEEQPTRAASVGGWLPGNGENKVHLEAVGDPKTGYGHGSATLQLLAHVLHACVCSCWLGLHLGVHLLRSVGLGLTSR